MRYDYVVTLKRENARRTDLASFLLLLFSLISFTLVQLRNGMFSPFLTFSALIVLAGMYIQIRAARKGKEMRFRNWLLAGGVCWLGMPFFQWMILVFILFALLEGQAKYPLEIGFSKEQIVMNTLVRTRIKWPELQSVILKDGLLTLDFKNNRVIQKEVLDDDEPDADEDEFNVYCQERLMTDDSR